jgi:hypothetical protein
MVKRENRIKKKRIKSRRKAKQIKIKTKKRVEQINQALDQRLKDKKNHRGRAQPHKKRKKINPRKEKRKNREKKTEMDIKNPKNTVPVKIEMLHSQTTVTENRFLKIRLNKKKNQLVKQITAPNLAQRMQIN